MRKPVSHAQVAAMMKQNELFTNQASWSMGTGRGGGFPDAPGRKKQ